MKISNIIGTALRTLTTKKKPSKKPSGQSRDNRITNAKVKAGKLPKRYAENHPQRRGKSVVSTALDSIGRKASGLRTRGEIKKSKFKKFEDGSFQGKPSRKAKRKYTFYEDNTFKRK